MALPARQQDLERGSFGRPHAMQGSGCRPPPTVARRSSPPFQERSTYIDGLSRHLYPVSQFCGSRMCSRFIATGGGGTESMSICSAWTIAVEHIPPMDLNLSLHLKTVDMLMLNRLCIYFDVQDKFQGVQELELGTEMDIVVRASDNTQRKDFFPNLHFITIRQSTAKAYASCWTLLQHSSSVEHLHIGFRPRPETNLRPSVPSFDLPHLKSIYLNMRWENAFQVLNQIFIPSLRRLNLKLVSTTGYNFDDLSVLVHKWHLTHAVLPSGYVELMWQ